MAWWSVVLLGIAAYVIEQAIRRNTRELKAELAEVQSLLRDLLTELQTRK